MVVTILKAGLDMSDVFFSSSDSRGNRLQGTADRQETKRE